MILAAAIFLTASAGIYIAAWFSRKGREMDQCIAEALTEPDDEWLALLAAVEPQVHDQLVCEEIERREWSS